MSKFLSIQHPVLYDAPYDLVSLTDARGTLTLRLEGTTGTFVDISFDGYLFYSKMDEGDALRTLQMLGQESCIGSTLIEGHNSNLIDWFNREGFGIRSKDKLSNYVLLTRDDVVNVISIGFPAIIAI